MIGKPYSGKLNVRFDEGELEIGHQLLRQLSTLPFYKKGSVICDPLLALCQLNIDFSFFEDSTYRSSLQFTLGRDDF
jgi:hypothetical protein